MGLTEKGFVRRTYDEILNDKIQRAKELFGADIDTSDQSVLGKYLRINAYDQAIASEETEAVYYSSKPNTASGQSLDRLMPIGGLSRNPATAAVFSVTIHGTAGYVIPVGFLVGTEADVTFYTASEATIGEDGTCTVNVECTQTGTIGNVGAGAINSIVNPDASITAVAGVECITPGTDDESDTALRERFKLAMTGSGGCSENAIRAALLRIPTVQYAAVVSNDDSAADEEGRPAHSFECYVQGGDDYEQEIAQAIFSMRPVGIQTVGDKAVTVIDACGNEKVVRYSETPSVPVTVRTTIKTGTSFPSEGAALIEANITGYINGLGVGNSLVLSAIYGHIYSITGVLEVVSLELSTDGGSSFTTNNVTVPKYGVVICNDVTVEVTA